MDVPSIVFILLFILVVILILLHRINKKYADRISILEQTLDMKSEALTSLKATYTEAKETIENDNTQKNNEDLQKQNKEKSEHHSLELTQLQSTISEKDTMIQTLEEKLSQLESRYENMQEENQKLPIETKVLHAIEEGMNSASIAKLFHIPKKRVELIIKLNHIQRKHKAMSTLEV